MASRVEVLESLQKLMDTIEAFDPAQLTDRTFYDEARSAISALREHLLHASSEIVESAERFVSDLSRYFLDDFPRVFHQPFRRFGLDARYELGQQEFDITYTYQDAWAAERVFRLRPRFFVDVGSTVSFVTITSRLVPCIAIDARPTPLILGNLTYRQAVAQALPFPDESVSLLTCLHAMDHFGLGRYGDPVGNGEVAKAVAEFERVVAKNGFLILGVPTRLEPTTWFNKMHLFTPELVRSLFGRFDVLDELFLAPSPVSREQHDALLRLMPTAYGSYVALLRKTR